MFTCSQRYPHPVNRVSSTAPTPTLSEIRMPKPHAAVSVYWLELGSKPWQLATTDPVLFGNPARNPTGFQRQVPRGGESNYKEEPNLD